MISDGIFFEKALTMTMTFPVFDEPMSEETQEVSDEPPSRGLKKKSAPTGFLSGRAYFFLKKLFSRTADVERNGPHRCFLIPIFQTTRG